MDDFLAVVVLYKTRLSCCDTLISLNKTLLKNGSKLDLVVYDNSPSYNTPLEHNFQSFNILYHPNPDNAGVSTAYNFGHEIALGKGKKWIILLDQDTVFQEKAIEAYLNAIERYPGECLFAPVMQTADNKIISPGNFRWMRGSYATQVEYGVNYFKGHSLINSGLCINVAAFSKNSGYNNLIKLDYSDHDFIHRFAKNVTEKYVVLELNLLHQLSTDNKNMLDSDKIRFDYYLEGARHFSAKGSKALLLRLVTLLRSTKLSLSHRNPYFIKKYFTYLFS